jgi:hypothetical protein
MTPALGPNPRDTADPRRAGPFLHASGLRESERAWRVIRVVALHASRDSVPGGERTFLVDAMDPKESDGDGRSVRCSPPAGGALSHALGLPRVA